MKKKILILTLNDYIIYQPSILNLYDYLQPKFDVQIVSFLPASGVAKKDEVRNIVYLETKPFLRNLYQKFDFALSIAFTAIKKIAPSSQFYHTYYNKYLPDVLKKGIKTQKLKGDIIIAADFPALRVAQGIYGSVHFISLEIENNTNKIHKKINRSLVKSVFIQSRERYEYLFPNNNLPVFYVQNAPVFKEENITSYTRKDFIWSGAMDRRLAIYDCINFFDKYAKFRLVLKGSAEKKVLDTIHQNYQHLINEDRLKIDQEYLPASSFLDYLSRFRIGFVFYSWDLIAQSFNYATAPSGKLFMNLAAGVPVIACNIPGFKLVEDFKAGVLINDFEPETIYNAILKVESEYEAYRQGCYAAARHYSFDKTVAPYINFLIKNNY